jgi:hypothetical protein
MCVGVSTAPLPAFVAGILRSAKRLGEQIPASPRVSVVTNVFLATLAIWIGVPLWAVRRDPIVVNKERMKAGSREDNLFCIYRGRCK